MSTVDMRELSLRKLSSVDSKKTEKVSSGEALTAAQMKIAPARLRYYSLLLYRIVDLKGAELTPFGWQLCSGYRIGDLKRWLTSGTFPSETTSAHVVQALSLGQIGTDDPSVIELVAGPEGRSWASIDVNIDWPDDAAPPPTLSITKQENSLSRQVLTLRRW